MKVADEVWIATALLHRSQPEREGFSLQEIVRRALQEDVPGGYRSGLQAHASGHCVATKPASPARLRMLAEVGRGRRRLFRPGDPYHPSREHGKIVPEQGDIPERFTFLLEWYAREYVPQGARQEALPPGAPAAALLKFAGAIAAEDLNRMEEAIRDCERIDSPEW